MIIQICRELSVPSDICSADLTNERAGSARQRRTIALHKPGESLVLLRPRQSPERLHVTAARALPETTLP